jgi:hypothetical protein
MKLLKLTMVLFLMSFICNSWVFCQFRVIPQINMEINVEEDYIYPPHELVFVGIGVENRGVRFIELDFDKKHYSLYNVKPGKYLVSIVDDNASIIFQYQTVTISYPDDDVFYRKNTGFLNEVEVRNNRNLKLKITFKMHYDYHGYQKVSDVEYKDFDYSELIFYSSHFSGEIKKNIRETRQNPYSICGSNTGWSEKSLGFSCSLDGGNININIQKAYFENTYMGEQSAGYTQGGTTLGPDKSSTQKPPPLTCGVVTTTGYFLDNKGNNNPCPGEWDGIIVTANCDEATEICIINISYNVAVFMETVIWKKEEMCKEKISFDNKPLYDQNNSSKSKCYCDCYLEAVIAHEAKHCENWIDSTADLNAILQDFCINNQNTYKALSCCPYEHGDNKCIGYANKIKNGIIGLLNWEFKKRILDSPDYSPEGESDSAEQTKFRQCSDRKHCKNK